MNNWINVKERLPEKDGFYLCTSRWKKNMDFVVETLKYSTRICPTIPDWMKANVFANGGAFGEMWSDGLDNKIRRIKH